MIEASLILELERLETNIGNNINWTISCDYGGERPKHDFEAHLEHFVYLALVPLPRLHQPVDTRKTVPDHAVASTQRGGIATTESVQR